MLRSLLILSTLLCAYSSPLTPCPESCNCTHQSQSIDLQCSSQDFLEKLLPKQVNAIVSLDLTNTNLTSLNPKLKKLRNLKKVYLSHNHLGAAPELQQLQKLTYINLKGNHLKHLTASSLPTHLKHLELSHNYINNIPKTLKHLSELKEVNLAGNPIVCSCDTISEYKVLLKNRVKFLKPVLCHSPEKLQGLPIDSLTCADLKIDPLDQMQGDEPLEGSGDEPEPEPELEPVDQNEHEHEHEHEHEISPLDNTHVLDTSNKNYTGIEDEELIPESPRENITNDDTWSGDDNEDVGSGDDTIPTIPNDSVELKACNFNCSNLTLDFEPELDSTKDPDIFNEIGKAFKDIFPFGETESEASSSEPPEEPLIVKEHVETNRALNPSVQNEKIEVASTEVDSNLLNESEKSAFNTNLLIVILLILIMVILVIISILKRRKSRSKRAEPAEQEMKTLSAKPANGNSAPEKVPLMNGQNGNMNGKPVEEPVPLRRNEELDSKESPAEDEVVLRKKNKEEESLLPETHRVKIQAKELSTPKTPLLVNRLRSDDGETIITLLKDQRM